MTNEEIAMRVMADHQAFRGNYDDFYTHQFTAQARQRTTGTVIKGDYATAFEGLCIGNILPQDIAELETKTIPDTQMSYDRNMEHMLDEVER